MRKTLAVLLILFAGMPVPALAWGPRGHEVVAHIAAMNLTPRARAAVTDLMGGDAQAMMAIQASWADEIRDARPETAPWHFVNLEIDGDLRYSPGRDCRGGNCVVAQIARQESILRGNAPRAAKAEALRFLIHFMGDVQQPLHAADNHDRGGNRVRLLWRGQRITLHHFWDDDTVAMQGRDARAIACAIDAGTPRFEKLRMAVGSPAAWAQTAAAIARNDIYPRMGQGRSPSSEESTRYGRLAWVQLARGGYALAGLLNAIYR